MFARKVLSFDVNSQFVILNFESTKESFEINFFLAPRWHCNVFEMWKDGQPYCDVITTCARFFILILIQDFCIWFRVSRFVTTPNSGTMVQINQMNDDCLIAIFSLFSMRELICLRIVCRRFHAISELGKQMWQLCMFVFYANSILTSWPDENHNQDIWFISGCWWLCPSLAQI